MAVTDFGKQVARELEKQQKKSPTNSKRSYTPKAAPKRRGNTTLPDHLKEHCFKPGHTGNPNGRPKKTPITDALRTLLDSKAPAKLLKKYVPGHGGDLTYGEVFAASILDRAAGGSDRMVEVVLDRIEGKVNQTVSGPGGGPIPVDLSSPEENAARLATLLSKARAGTNGGGTDGNRKPDTA